MQLDHGEKTPSSKLRVQSKNSKKEQENVISETEEEEEDEEDESYTPRESAGNSEEDDESYSGSEASASEEDITESPDSLSPAKAMKKQKELRTKKVKGKRKVAGKKASSSEKKKNDDEERQHPPSKSSQASKEKPTDATDETNEKDTKKGGKKEVPAFNDRNVDLDLFHSSPTNVIARKVKVSSNLIVTCRNIDQIEGARSGSVGYDFAALTFQRKTNNDKMFEFVVPLALAPRITEAINHIIEENKKFFKPQI